jgi:hypothetical protein
MANLFFGLEMKVSPAPCNKNNIAGFDGQRDATGCYAIHEESVAIRAIGTSGDVTRRRM